MQIEPTLASLVDQTFEITSRFDLSMYLNQSLGLTKGLVKV